MCMTPDVQGQMKEDKMLFQKFLSGRLSTANGSCAVPVEPVGRFTIVAAISKQATSPAEKDNPRGPLNE